MKRLMFVIAVFCFPFVGYTQNSYPNEVLSIADSVAYEHIRELNVKDYDTCYVNIRYGTLRARNGLISFSASTFTRPYSDTEYPPFHYSKISKERDKHYVAFHFADHISFNRDSIISKLRTDNLLIEVMDGKITGEDWRFLLETEEAWHVFICKDDYSRLKVIKSFTVIDEVKVPQELCN